MSPRVRGSAKLKSFFQHAYISPIIKRRERVVTAVCSRFDISLPLEHLPHSCVYKLTLGLPDGPFAFRMNSPPRLQGPHVLLHIESDGGYVVRRGHAAAPTKPSRARRGNTFKALSPKLVWSYVPGYSMSPWAVLEIEVYFASIDFSIPYQTFSSISIYFRLISKTKSRKIEGKDSIDLSIFAHLENAVQVEMHTMEHSIHT